jgi:RNA 2',3'-cyclic 3'-phosphodiesterase
VRLFVALEIPAAVRDNLAAFIKDTQSDTRERSDRSAEKRVRWVRPENLHVTLKFIGEVAEARLNGIRAALSAVQAGVPLELRVHGLGFFPNESRPTVLWTGLDAPTNLLRLAGDIDRALATQDIAKEKRAFVPHLTLARFAQPILHEELRAAIQKNSAREFGSFQAREFHLIESKLKPSGAEYTRLQTFRFGAES